MTSASIERSTATTAVSRMTFGLVALLGGAGVTHFVAPKGFDGIVPHALPGSPRMWTYASGVAEMIVAGTIAMPRTRRLGAGLAALLFIAVLPANVQMAIDWKSRSLPQRLIAYGRLPLQLPLIWLALRVRKGRSAITVKDDVSGRE